jgi:hypothetical protein
MAGLQTAEQLKTAPLGSAERAPRTEPEPRAPDKGMDGSTGAGPMTSSKSPHRPVQAKGEVGFTDASVFMKEVAGGDKKPVGPAPKPKGLETKGNTDGGMDSADGSADDAPAAPPGDAASAPPAAAAPPPPSGGGGEPAGAPADAAAPAVDKGARGKGRGKDTAAAQVGKKILTAGPSDFIAEFKSIGSQLSAAKKKDEAKGFAKMPTLKAVLPDDAQAAAAKKAKTPKADDTIKDGVDGPDAKLPEKGKEKPQKAAEQKVSGGDAAKLKELEGILEHLKSFFGGILGGLSTESKVKTDPGAPPPVKLEGQSNPVRAPKQEGDATGKIDDAHVKYAKAIDDGPGPQDVHRQPMEELIPPTKMPDVQVVEGAIDEGMAYYESISITAKERQAADKLLAPAVKGKMAKVDSDLETTLDRQEKERDKAIEDSEAQTEALNTEAQAEQEKIVAKTKKEIDSEQSKTKKAQEGEVKKAKKKGDKERRLVEKKVKKRQKDDDKRVKSEFKKAKKKAGGEKDKAHKKAKDEKRKAEEKKKKQSWWDRVKSAVSSVVNAVCKVIGGIFDVLGKLVSGIINAVKDLACGIIDLACKFAKGLLDGLGKLLKGLVSGLLGKVFPELAKKLNGYIDQGVALAKKGVDFVGDNLKKGVEAAAKTVNGVVQKGLQVVKTGMQTAVRVAGCIATGDFKGAFLQVFYGACEIAGISRATAEKVLGSAKDTLKKIIDKPVAFIKNLIKAGAGGISKFVSGFVGFLKKAFIDWIVGPLAKGGLKIPKAFNVVGIFKMVASMLGVTKDWVFGLVEKKLGPGAKAVLEKVMEYVDAFMKGGISGIWEQIQKDVGNLWEMMLTFVVDFVKSKVVMMAAEKLASLLAGPIGALWQIVKTAYNIYTTIRDKIDKIKEVLSGIFGSIGDIARGNLGGATSKVVSALVAGLSIAIDLFAKIASIGGIPKKIRGWLTKVGKKVRGAIEKLIDKVVKKVKGLFKSGKADKDGKGKKKDKKDAPGKLPPPRKFKSKDGKAHKVYAEKKGQGATIMVASTPTPVKTKVQEWRKTLKELPKETRGRAGQLIGKVIAIEKAGDKIADNILKGEAKAPDLSKKLAEAEGPLGEVFAIIEGAGGGKIDPNSTLATKKYGTFKGQFCEVAREVDMKENAQKDAERIWILSVKTILEKDTKGQFAAVPKAEDGRAKLSDAAMKKVMADLKPITGALKKYMAAHAKKNSKGTWAFWSGKPADPVARKNCKMSLEKSALGKVFDGVNIDGSWNIELWATLSQAYATYAAKNFEQKEFRGFVGHGSKADQSIFNKIEQPTFKMLTKSKKAKPSVKFYAVAGKAKKSGDRTFLEPDWSKTAGSCQGVFATGDRAAMVAKAEEYNDKILKGDDPGAGGGGKKPVAKDVPKQTYKDANNHTHSVYVEGTKGKVKAMHASVPQHLRVVEPRGDTFEKSKKVEEASSAYLGLPDTATEAQKKEGLDKVKKAMRLLMKAMETARGDRKKIVKQRTEMEKLLGKRVLSTYKQGRAAADEMAQKCIKLILDKLGQARTHADRIDKKFLQRLLKNPRVGASLKTELERTGMSLTSGYAGAVDVDAKKIVKALTGGNMRTKVQHVIQFGDQFAEIVFSRSDGKLSTAVKEIIGNDAAIDAIEKRVEGMDDPTKRGEGFGRPTKDAKGLLGDKSGGDGEFKDAKDMKTAGGKDHEMDDKLPGIPVDALKYNQLFALAQTKDFPGKHGTPRAEVLAFVKDKIGDKTPKGGGQPLTRSKRRLDDPNVKMGADEKKAKGLSESGAANVKKLLPFSEGVIANLIDPNHWWVKAAKKLEMPLKAGISGNTHRWMNMSKQLGVKAVNARLTMYGQLIPINAHSYHEISAAARAHVPYNDGKYFPLEPLTRTQVNNLAKAVEPDKGKHDLLLGLSS